MGVGGVTHEPDQNDRASRKLGNTQESLLCYLDSSSGHQPRHPFSSDDMHCRSVLAWSFASLFMTQPALCQGPGWLWAHGAGSVSNDYGNAVCTDVDGNVYMTGTFQGASITFGAFTLQNTSEGFLDFFVVKYDPQGNVIWAISDGGASDDFAYGICTDPSDNVFVTGYFNSPSLVIGTSVLTNVLTAVNAPEVFVAKYGSNGQAIWGRCSDAGPTQNYARAYGIDSDASGNVYVSGHYGYDASVNFDGITLPSYGAIDMFLVKYDTDGNVLWAERMGGSDGDYIQAVHVEPSGNIYMTGAFINSANFGGITLTSTNTAYEEVFVAKYDSSGNSIWANYALVPYAGNYASGTSIATDQLGNVYLTGHYQYSISFGDDSLSTAGNRGTFLAKYDNSGTPLWGRSPGGTGNDVGSGVAVEPDGNVLYTGYFESAFLNFGAFPVINSNVGFYDGFVARYDTNGNALGAVGIGGPGDEYAMGVTSSPSGSFYSAGYFGSYILDFSGMSVVNAGSHDAFLAKMDQNGFVGVHSAGERMNVLLYPNPAHDQLNVISEGPAVIRIFDMAARLVQEQRFTNTTTIDVGGLPSGLYAYELMSNGALSRGKFVRD